MNAKIITIRHEQAGQRIDNFLMNQLKGLPKSRIYRAIRKGEVRVNKRRVKALYRIQTDDQIRIPPLSISEKSGPIRPNAELAAMLENQIILEDKSILLINKPSGLPVHGGTNVSAGLIEMLRSMRPKCQFLELAHRLDRSTSGCLLIVKKRRVLVEFHQQLANRQVKKSYLLLVKGRWQGGEKKVESALKKQQRLSGERIVKTDQQGKPSKTIFKPIRQFNQATLLLAIPITGRTHQIRVHAASIGYPIAGDDKYGDKLFNREMQQIGLRRLFLHSASIEFTLPDSEICVSVCTPLPMPLPAILTKMTSCLS